MIVKELQVILGFCIYCGHFVCHFAEIPVPLYALLYKEAAWHWTDTEDSDMNFLYIAF